MSSLNQMETMYPSKPAGGGGGGGGYQVLYAAWLEMESNTQPYPSFTVNNRQ